MTSQTKTLNRLDWALLLGGLVAFNAAIFTRPHDMAKWADISWTVLLIAAPTFGFLGHRKGLWGSVVWFACSLGMLAVTFTARA